MGRPRDKRASFAVTTHENSVEAILARHGEQQLDPQEFKRHFGSLPADRPA
jgi:hypothetical protein